jgi:hypothetical protein
LNGGRVQRQDHRRHAMLIHQPESLVVQIEQPAAQFFPGVFG